MNLSKWKPKPVEHPDFEQAIRLQEAVLCLSCDTIRHARRAVCPACGADSGFNLARWLNREAA